MKKSDITKMKKAFSKYGFNVCMGCYEMNRADGEGCTLIGENYDLKTNQVDAAIDAYEIYLNL